MWAHGGSSATFLVETIADAYGVSLGSTLMILLLALALPIVTEVVFRGIVLRSLARIVSVPASVVASTMLFALWYPVLGWYGSVALGVISAILYVRTRTLTASIVANSVLTVGSAAIIIVVAFR
jgi:membrane protease YdiL (CAAX protease family)